jgi:hypothetical protein
MGPAQQQQPASSMAGSLMPDMPPAGFSGQDLMIGEEGPDAIFEPFLLPSLLGSDFPGYQPDTGSYREFASDWMPAELQTAGGLGYQGGGFVERQQPKGSDSAIAGWNPKDVLQRMGLDDLALDKWQDKPWYERVNFKGGGLVDYMMPQGYQDGGQVGYGTATEPIQALEQMGMEDVARDPKLKDFMEDLPQFGMGYEQDIGDLTFQGRTGLMNIGSEGRLTQARSGFAGGGAGSMIESMQRTGVKRGFETGRRGVVEGYQADLLSAIADIEAKGGFEFGTGESQADTASGGTAVTDPNQYAQVAPPTEGGSQVGQVSGSGEWTWNGTSWVPSYLYEGPKDISGGYKASDVRVKSNIDYLFSLDNGIPIYLFKYIGSDELNMGTIAQEAEKIIPEAVIENADGIKYVNYDIIYRQGV